MSVCCRIGSMNRVYSVTGWKLLHTTSNNVFAISSSRQITNKSVNYYRQFVLKLNNDELLNLETALEQTKNMEREQMSLPPSSYQLRLVVLQSTLPFIGFGFLDNLIMILAGEYIDMTIGVSLGISTMAAAACGNLISDLFGLGLADSVESLCRWLGLPNPKLSLYQMESSSVRWSQRMGRVLGITIGCIIGMAPLLWFKDDVHHH